MSTTIRQGVTPPEKRCGRPKANNGGECGHPKGWGTDHPGYGPCKMHFGNAPAGKAAAAREVEAEQETAIAKAAARWVEPREGAKPGDLLLERIRYSAGMVDWYRGQLEALVGASGAQSLIHGIQSVSRTVGALAKTSGRPDRDGETTTVAGPGVNLWLKLHNEEVDRLTRMCKDAIGLGLDARRVQLEEQQGRLAGEAVRALLEGLQLTQEQQTRVPDLVRRHLALLRGTG